MFLLFYQVKNGIKLILVLGIVNVFHLNDDCGVLGQVEELLEVESFEKY